MHRVNVVHRLLINLKLIVIEDTWVQKFFQLSDGPIVLLTFLGAELLDELLLGLIWLSVTPSFALLGFTRRNGCITLLIRVGNILF